MLSKLWTLVYSSFEIWNRAQASRMSAALTYYTMLSLAPMLLIAIAIAGYVYDDAAAQQELLSQVKLVTNEGIAKTVSGLIRNATTPNSGLLAGTVSLVILLFGASGVFSQLYDTLNDIWQVPYSSRAGFRFSVQKRLIGIGMVLLIGCLLIGTLMLSSVITYLNGVLTQPLLVYWLNLVDRSLSFLLMPVVFTLMFWFFPAIRVSWSDVWPAGVLTAFLVASSRYLIEAYLRFSSTSEVYGAAGSLVILLIWVYMTGLVVFYGASFSHAWANTFGSRKEAELEELPLAESFQERLGEDSEPTGFAIPQTQPLVPHRRVSNP